MNCKYCNIQTINDTDFCSHICSTTYYNKFVWDDKRTGKCKECSYPILGKRVYCNVCWDAFLAKPRKRARMTLNKYCKICKEEKTVETTQFVDGLWHDVCRPCDAKEKASRVKNFKEKCVEYKGGKCVVCGYDKYHGALEFHHLDPTQKDFTIARKKTNKFDEKITSELDKCALLCANCHAEEHSKIKLGESLLNTTFSVWDFVLNQEKYAQYLTTV